MCDQRIPVAVLVGVYDHAGRFIGQQDVFIFIDDIHLWLRDVAEGIFLAWGVKVFVVKV